MGPEVVAGAAIGGLALDAAGSIFKGQGEKASQEYLAARDRRAAELGRIKADQTDAGMREELNTTLANIDVIRAAAGTDPLSPTGLAIRENERRIGDRDRRIRVSNINEQAADDDASAEYRRYVGKTALTGSYISAGSKLLSGIGRMK